MCTAPTLCKSISRDHCRITGQYLVLFGCRMPSTSINFAQSMIAVKSTLSDDVCSWKSTRSVKYVSLSTMPLRESCMTTYFVSPSCSQHPFIFMHRSRHPHYMRTMCNLSECRNGYSLACQKGSDKFRATSTLTTSYKRNVTINLAS